MSTIVITGGTHGIGRALARQRLRVGDTVVAVGSSVARGEQFLRGVAEDGGRAWFVAADLARVRETRRVIDRIQAEHPEIDALVLGANRISTRRARTLTEDGFEYTFALYYLSRHVLTHGLRPCLERAPRPCVLNVAGPGITIGQVHWDDPQLSKRWSNMRAQLQAGRANDLLGPAAAARGGRTRHVAYNPGFTDTRPFTGMAQPWRAAAELAAALLAAAPEQTATAIGRLIDAPPDEPFSAWRRRGTMNRRIDPGLPTFNPSAATRLDTLTRDLLGAIPS